MFQFDQIATKFAPQLKSKNYIIGGQNYKMKDTFKRLGVHIPEILLPVSSTDLTKWAVIACDQYTSQPEYWDKVSAEVGENPSTLKLTFPEIYLKDGDKEERIESINKTMEQYLAQCTLDPQEPCFILVDRSTPHTSSRKGLILALDLECYDYRPGAQTLIRATEGTVLDRIPPRVKIRENAPIELPHIMVLIDDPDKTVIEALYAKAEAGSFKKLYDFDLMQGGGHIKGWKVSDEESLSMVARALDKLEQGVCSCGDGSSGDGSHIYNTSSNESNDSPTSKVCNLLFAVGDGNHSLASAKAHWENVKAELIQARSSDRSLENQPAGSSIPDHPARYALVEIVNVHDEGMVFEPIHRVLFNINAESIIDMLKTACSELGKSHVDSGQLNGGQPNDTQLNGSQLNKGQPNDSQLRVDYRFFATMAEMESGKENLLNEQKQSACHASAHLLPFILEDKFGILIVQNPVSNIEVGTLQSILDQLLISNPEIEVDYIHGDQVVTELGSKPGSMGFYLPVMSKHDLFPTVKLDGVLPRKTFSMGEAEEKRYYLECRRIR